MKTVVASLLSLSSICAFANDTAVDPLKAEAELGLLITNGNTESESIYGKLKVNQDLENWKNEYILRSLYKKDKVEVEVAGEKIKEEQTTAHSTFASVQSDYKLDSEHRSLFVFASYEDDRFSGFDYQSTIAAGYSDRLFETENSNLDYSVGPGVSFTKTSIVYDDTGAVVEESEEYTTGVLHASASYLYQISDSAKFTQDVRTDIAAESDRNSKVISETALVANINKSFAMKASYTVNYNSKAPDDKRHTDSRTALTLVFTM
ncbi:DUF481 domain-containing protein [Teredinibacter sp. KSP-S5-2]|uniref:DUF481 domain-containing protein n=1 Tax=Teredinibacter sp. KSP-S5-2 TaxID=3034506 RepID=UPI00293456C5|nr:DUF481 domain-containing protein [Teredinibacter sp. KSP-S5-2]WNO08289.1 DUF481 domain-containing protein [Teredinibacter sp. KSP-S5-2]